MRQAYWQYIENIIDYSEEDNNTERKSKQKKIDPLSICEKTQRVLPHCAARETLSARPQTKPKY